MDDNRTTVRTISTHSTLYAAGKVAFVSMSHNGGGASPRRSKQTPSTQSAIFKNTLKVFRSILLLINGNFSRGDYLVNLTLNQTHFTESVEVMDQRMRAFLRSLRDYCKRHGICVRYLGTLGWGDSNGRLHVHLLVSSSGLSMEAISRRWRFGDCKITSIYTDKGADTLFCLGTYIAEHACRRYLRASGHSYYCSRTLIQPTKQTVTSDAQALYQCVELDGYEAADFGSKMTLRTDKSGYDYCSGWFVQTSDSVAIPDLNDVMQRVRDLCASEAKTEEGTTQQVCEITVTEYELEQISKEAYDTGYREGMAQGEEILANHQLEAENRLHIAEANAYREGYEEGERDVMAQDRLCIIANGVPSFVAYGTQLLYFSGRVFIKKNDVFIPMDSNTKLYVTRNNTFIEVLIDGFYTQHRGKVAFGEYRRLYTNRCGVVNALAENVRYVAQNGWLWQIDVQGGFIPMGQGDLVTYNGGNMRILPDGEYYASCGVLSVRQTQSI